MLTEQELRSKLEKTYPVLCKDSIEEINRKVNEVFPGEPRVFRDPDGIELNHSQMKQVRHLLNKGYTGGVLAYVGNTPSTIQYFINKRDPYSICYVKSRDGKFQCQDNISWDFAEKLLY